MNFLPQFTRVPLHLETDTPQHHHESPLNHVSNRLTDYNHFPCLETTAKYCGQDVAMLTYPLQCILCGSKRACRKIYNAFLRTDRPKKCSESRVKAPRNRCCLVRPHPKACRGGAKSTVRVGSQYGVFGGCKSDDVC